MKLRNKKTGEIREIKNILIDEMFNVNSLAELNAEWEDYEELPKGYWIIEPYGKVEYIKLDRHWSEDLFHQFKDFGNYFETKEEAEKAVERLRAWKRLKDKKAKIVGWCYSVDVDLDGGGCEFNGDDIIVGIDSGECDVNDLDLLFGGEE